MRLRHLGNRQGLHNDEEWNGCYLLSAEEKASIQRKMEQYHHGANTLQTVLKDYAEEKVSVLEQLAKAKAAAPPFPSKSYAPECEWR